MVITQSSLTTVLGRMCRERERERLGRYLATVDFAPRKGKGQTYDGKEKYVPTVFFCLPKMLNI